jgi:ferredoxin
VQLGPRGAELSLEPSERLLDALDAALDEQLAQGKRGGQLPALPTACRAANCGACLVRIESGSEAFEPARERERALLQQLGAAPEDRLGCQLHARAQLSAGSMARVATREPKNAR